MTTSKDETALKELILTNIATFGGMWSESPWTQARKALSHIKKLTHDKHIRVILTFIPNAKSLLYRAHYPTRQTLKIAQELGWTGIELDSALIPDLGCNYYTPELLSTADHSVVANSIVNHLR
jgi:hypothetical protein